MMVQPRTILVFCVMLMSMIMASDERRVQVKSRHNSEPALSISLTEAIIENIGHVSITAHEEDQVNELKNRINKNLRADNYTQCYSAINAYTKDMFSGSYKLMLGSQFSDLGDLGDYSQCDSIENADYNIVQVNLTNLPLDFRLGICLPSECNWDIMKSAGEAMTDTLSKVTRKIGQLLNVDLLTKWDVGVQVYFFQPTARNAQVTEEGTTSAASMAGFIGFLALISIGISIYDSVRPVTIKPNPPENFKKQTAQVMQQQELDFARQGTAAQTLKTKPSETSRTSTFNNGLAFGQNQQLRENSLFNENENVEENEVVAPPEMFKNSDSAPSVLRQYMDCFSLQKNVCRLSFPRRNKLDNPELDAIEGMKVITLIWGIIMSVSLYVLTATSRNITIMLDFFSQLIFAFVSSGNNANDFFFTVFTMMSFVKINQLYDHRNGLGLFDYGGILLHNFLKIAPLYYFVFFAGWILFPMLFSSANWFVADRFFVSCHSDWPFVLTFLNTYFPYFTKALEGCYYWAYLVSHYMMFSFLLPLWVTLYRWNLKAFFLAVFLLQVGGMFVVGYISWTHELTVGILTLEDYYLYTYVFNKAHTKLFNISLGLFGGYVYLRILKYRKASYEEKKEYFRILHFFHN